jgi:membrane-associated phospholipid phosphatase
VTQFLKQVVYPGELRPVGLELEHITVRRVLGLELNKTSSFPSGHTSQAFTLALLLVCIFKNKVWCFILPSIAFLVGYSRVYLGQHYVIDVCAGILVGILSAYLALQLYKAILRQKAEKPN